MSKLDKKLVDSGVLKFIIIGTYLKATDGIRNQIQLIGKGSWLQLR
jgi:hypothetical protein